METKNNFHYDILIDANLGKLARHLRFYGVSVYFNIKSNHLSLEILADKHNINILTTAKIHRRREYCLQIPSELKTLLKPQLTYISEMYHINRMFNLNNTRCGLCNTILSEIHGPNKFDILPSETKEIHLKSSNNKKIWYCTECKKYYWEGSHWKQIKSKIEDL